MTPRMAMQALIFPSRLDLAGRGLVLTLALSLLASCASEPKPRLQAARPPIHLAVVRDALSMKGIPYRWGEETPERGFDCSGLVQYVYGKYGVPLPRTAYQMAMALPELDDVYRQPGDLVFFNTTGKPYSHVGIYIGNDHFVHASSAKGKVVVSPLSTPFWTDHYLGMRRPGSGSRPATLKIGRWVP
jgi:cell wall-associated NlpC family hydrolase